MAAALLVVGALFYLRSEEQSCGEWQSNIRSAVRDLVSNPGFHHASESFRAERIQEIIDENPQPEGCPVPDLDP